MLKLGQTDGDFVQVISGLASGDRVVIDGADRLREGAATRVVADAAKPSAGAPARQAEAGSDATAPAANGAAPGDPSPGHHHGHGQKPTAGTGGNGQ